MNKPQFISPNPHPIWQSHFGIRAVESIQTERKARNADEALIQAALKLAANHPKPR